MLNIETHTRNIGENMPTQIRVITQKYLMSVNCYLVKTPSGYILIDTGLQKKRNDLVRELETARCKPGDLNLILITHGHLDHNGNTAYLREWYDVEIATVATQQWLKAEICSGV
jgi:hydroxyacylglutathione hydrolase